MTDDEIDALVGINKEDFIKNFMKVRKNGLLLTDKQVETLERYNIDPGKCGSTSELLYMIDEALDGYDDDECADLSSIADVLSERRYYEEVNK